MGHVFDAYPVAALKEPADPRVTSMPAMVGYTTLTGDAAAAMHKSIDLVGERRSGRTTAALGIASLAARQGLRAAYIAPCEYTALEAMIRRHSCAADTWSTLYLIPHCAFTQYKVLVVDDTELVADDAKELIQRLRHPEASLIYWVREAPHKA